MTVIDKGSPPARRKVALALQGGGSHGAFTWSVLDRLLEEATIEVIGVTGTSAGAMNAVALADGLVRGGAKQARQGLRKFWTAIGEMNALASYLWPMSGETVAQLRLEKTLAYTALDMLTPQFVAVRSQPDQAQSVARSAHRSDRFRRPARAGSGSGHGVRDQLPHREAARVHRIRTSRSIPFWRRRACRSYFRRSKSTGSRTGTAATREILPLRRFCARCRSAT